MHLYRPDPAFRHLLFLFISVAVSAIASAQSVSEKAAKDELIYMSSEEPAMRKAFARAAETLPEFLSLAAKPKVGTSSYALKVAISDGRNTEYFWVNNFSNEGDLFAGTLSNQPRLVKKHQLGDRIAFRRVQIVDWTYFDESSRKTIGNFTACALISKEPPEQAAAVLRQYGLSCDN